MFPSLVIDDRRKGRSGGLMIPNVNTVSHRTTLLTNRRTELQLKKQAEEIAIQNENCFN